MSFPTLPHELISLVALELLYTSSAGISKGCFGTSTFAAPGPIFEHLFPLLLVSRQVHSAVLPIFTTAMRLSANQLLLYAAQTSNVPLASRVLSLGADIHTLGGHMSLDALQLAVFAHDPHMVSLLLANGADPNRPTGPTKWSLLDLATYPGNEDVAAVLLRHGAVYTQDVTTGLHAAVRSDSEYGIRVYVARGASLEGIIEHALEPQHGGCVDESIVRLLVELGADATAGLESAVYRGDLHDMQLLVELGGDVLEGSLFVVAVGMWHVEIVRFLIDSGVDVESMDEGGKRPIHHALAPFSSPWMMAAGGRITSEWVEDLHKRRLELLNMLVDAGADVDGRTRDGATALDLALALGEEAAEIVHLLRGGGACVD